MFIGDIKILPCFKATPPKPEKLERRERHCLEHGKFESVIVVDGAGNLTRCPEAAGIRNQIKKA